MKAQELVRRSVEGELKNGDRFSIVNQGKVDNIKFLKYNEDEHGVAAFLCIEWGKHAEIADSSIILGNEFEVME